MFNHVRLNGGDLEFLEGDRPEEFLRVFSASTIQSTATDVAKKLGSALVGKLGTQIGALIFDAIFPPGVPSYFDEVYDEIKKIVKEALAANTIDEINGRINGTQAWVENSYAPRKSSSNPPSRQDLYNDVTPYVNLMYTEAVQTLMLPRYAKAGLTVFMVAAGVHLALFQEQALVDPNQTDPENSSFATTVKINAKIYHDHVIKTYNEIVDTRKKQVSVVYDPFVDCVGNSCVSQQRYYWEDAYSNERSGYFAASKDGPPAEQRARTDCDAHIEKVVNQLKSDLGDPIATAEQWLKLVSNPIPKPA